MPFNLTFGTFSNTFDTFLHANHPGDEPSGANGGVEDSDITMDISNPWVGSPSSPPSSMPQIPGSYSGSNATSSLARLSSANSTDAPETNRLLEQSHSAAASNIDSGLDVVTMDYSGLYDEDVDITGEADTLQSQPGPSSVAYGTNPAASSSSGSSSGSSSTSLSVNLNTLKRRNSGTDSDDDAADYDDVEMAADGSYRLRTKIRFVEHPRLPRQLRKLYDQLRKERNSVSLLSAQLHELRQERVQTAWIARGVFDEMVAQRNNLSSQLQTAIEARDSTERELAEVARVLGVEHGHGPVSHQHVPRDSGEPSSSRSGTNQTVSVIHHTDPPILHAIQSLQAEAVESRGLLERSNAQLHATQAEVIQAAQNNSRLVTTVSSERDDALQRLEQVLQDHQHREQEYEQRFQQELEERLRQERQDISREMELEFQQRIREREQHHQRSLHHEVTRMQAQHGQQLAESVRARERLETRVHELERVRIQESQPAEQVRAAAEMAARSTGRVSPGPVAGSEQFPGTTEHTVTPRNAERVEEIEAPIISQNSHFSVYAAAQQPAEASRNVQEAAQLRVTVTEPTRSDTAQESVAQPRGDSDMNGPILNARAEGHGFNHQRLESRTATQASNISARPPIPASHSATPGPSQPSQTPGTRSGLSARAREKLPADPRLASIKATRRHSSNHADDHLTETITPPLRIRRPYTSSAPRVTRLRMPTNTSLPPSPITPTPASTQNPQLAYLRSPTLSSRMSLSPPPVTRLRSATTSMHWLSDDSEDEQLGASRDTITRDRHRTDLNEGLQSPSSPSPANGQTYTFGSANRTQRHESTNPPPIASHSTTGTEDLPTILSSLAGAVNTLREELTETRTAISTMNNSTSQVSGNGRTSRASRNSIYKTLPASRLNVQSRVDMMKVVRDALKDKFGIKQDTDIHRVIANGRHMASPQEAENFDAGLLPSPPLSPLRPYWDDIHCLWNESLANRFADDIMANHEIVETKDKVKKHFFQRLVTLKKELKRRVPRVDETPSQARERAEVQHQITLARGRVQNRQTTLFHTRKQICEEGLIRPDRAIWESLLRLVLALQTEGQSSDETEDETADVFHVRTRPWRNPSITKLLKYIDSYRDTTNNYGNRRSGKPFRTRLRVARPPLTQDRPIAGLPKNCYSDVFLNSRRQDQLGHLAAQDPIELPEFYNSDADDE